VRVRANEIDKLFLYKLIHRFRVFPRKKRGGVYLRRDFVFCQKFQQLFVIGKLMIALKMRDYRRYAEISAQILNILEKFIVYAVI
jgi:hypothetical protein